MPKADITASATARNQMFLMGLALVQHRFCNFVLVLLRADRCAA
jgi:hypothetical protein